NVEVPRQLVIARHPRLPRPGCVEREIQLVWVRLNGRWSVVSIVAIDVRVVSRCCETRKHVPSAGTWPLDYRSFDGSKVITERSVHIHRLTIYGAFVSGIDVPDCYWRTNRTSPRDRGKARGHGWAGVVYRVRAVPRAERNQGRDL